jgi:hypothetical protein
VIEAKDGLVFGEIPLSAMSGSEALTKAVLPLIKKACEHSRKAYTLEQVVDDMIAGRCAIWGVMKLPADLRAIAIVTRTLDVTLTGGAEVDALLPFVPELETMARDAGCHKLALSGPHWWAQSLEKGFRLAGTIFQRRLT